MSRLARRVALIALIVLGLQFLAALAIQFTLTRTLRREITAQMARGMEDAGVLRECTSRPGPWRHEDGWWSVWPLTVDGEVIGESIPFENITLPAPGTSIVWKQNGLNGLVYGSISSGCGGLLIVQHQPYPVAEGVSSRVALLITLRGLLFPAAAIALVGLTAAPLVRRIRAMSQAMNQVVEDGFEGSVAYSSDDELGEVARAFDAAATSARERLERLEHRDAVLRRAMADLAHDLRTPLATLKLSASGLPASSNAITIRAELAFLEGMTQNFEAVLGGDEEGELELVALDQLAERVQHRFAPLASDRALVFEVGLPDEALYVRAASLVLERALSNLVQNAFRFAKAHVVVLVFSEGGGGELRLEVRDDGPGFGDLSARAAERGVRGPQAAGEGFGLGLAIAEAAARRFGGRLELTKGQDGDTVVAMVLPRAQ